MGRGQDDVIQGQAQQVHRQGIDFPDQGAAGIGVFLLGLTRFAPGFSGYGADELFTLGLSLGLKVPVSDRLSVRGEARGFFMTTYSAGGIFCRNGACLFSYNASGVWQGDVSASLVISLGSKRRDPERRPAQSGRPTQEYCQATETMR